MGRGCTSKREERQYKRDKIRDTREEKQEKIDKRRETREERRDNINEGGEIEEVHRRYSEEIDIVTYVDDLLSVYVPGVHKVDE